MRNSISVAPDSLKKEFIETIRNSDTIMEMAKNDVMAILNAVNCTVEEFVSFNIVEDTEKGGYKYDFRFIMMDNGMLGKMSRNGGIHCDMLQYTVQVLLKANCEMYMNDDELLKALDIINGGDYCWNVDANCIC